VKILRCLSSLIELIPGTKYFSLSDCVEEFSNLMLLQLDMTLEADNLDKLRRNFLISSVKPERPQGVHENTLLEFLTRSFSPSSSLASGFIERLRSSRRVTFPEPKRPFVSTNILVESYEKGRPISEILDKMSNKTLRRDIATAGLDAVLKMVFIDNFIHAGKSMLQFDNSHLY
jgi:aarF domain-containing kinase